MKKFFSLLLIFFTLQPLIANADTPTLTEDEKRLYEIGEISSEKQVLGGILGVVPGYGIGHLVQGRFSERGYIFAIGEVSSLAVITLGAMSSSDCGTCGSKSNSNGRAVALIGAAGFLTFKIWEAIDVWMVNGHNNRVKAIKEKMGEKSSTINRSQTPEFFLIPTGEGGGLAGLAIHF